MKKQLRFKLQFAVFLLLGILGKSTHAAAQAFYFRNDIDSPGGNFSSMTVSIGKFQQSCIGGIGTMTNIPVNFSVNNTPYATEAITGFIVPYALSSTPICSSQAPVCGGGGTTSYLTTTVAFTYTFASKVIVSASGLTNINTKLYPGTGYGNFQAANINGTYSVQPEIFNAVMVGMINDLPYFVTDKSIIFSNVNQPVRVNCTAKDADGDSLVYRLRPVSPTATYATGFTYQNPITANPALALNSRTGEITFTPTYYDQAAGPGAPANTYIVGIDVDEYRKINGQPIRIGTIQRNLVVNVISTANQTPVITAFRNGTTIAPNTIIDVIPGTPVTLDFTTTDTDAADIVEMATNTQSVLPGSGFTTTSGQNPKSGQLTWIPMAADARKEPYFFNVTAKDNACPYTASSTSTFGIRVRNITGTKKDFSGSGSFYAYPNPFTSQVRFKLNASQNTQAILIYNTLGQQIDQIEIKNPTNGESEVQWEKAKDFAAGTYVARLLNKEGVAQVCRFSKLK